VKICLKLYGTLPNYYQGPYQSTGIAIILDHGATVEELADITGIPKKRIGLVSINNRIAKSFDIIPDGAEVKFMPLIASG
jgi:hypothetical protein